MAKRTNANNFNSLIQQLLGQYDVWQAGKERWRSCCPLHKGTNPSAFVINTNGKWHCFKGCGKGDIYDLVMRMFGLTFKQAQEYVGNSPAQFATLADVPVLPPWKERHKARVDYPIRKEAEIVLFKKNCPKYLTNRHFSPRALREYEIGYDYDSNRIVIPVRDVHGSLVGVTFRKDFDATEPKYWHDRFDKANHLYGFHLWKGKKVRRVLIVEGQLDVVRLWQLGLAAVAVMGSSIDERQVKLLIDYAQCNQLVLAFDNDDAGYDAAKKAVKAFVPTRFGRRLALLDYPTNDPGDLREYHRLGTKSWTSVLI